MWRVEVKGLREVEVALGVLDQKFDEAALLIVRDSAALLEREAKRNFIGSHRPGSPHVGGDKPNVVTGTLRRSIHSTPVHRTGLGAWAATVGPSTVYARRVELGYPGGPGRGRQATRAFPYFKPAAATTRERMYAIAVTHWRAALLS